MDLPADDGEYEKNHDGASKEYRTGRGDVGAIGDYIHQHLLHNLIEHYAQGNCDEEGYRYQDQVYSAEHSVYIQALGTVHPSDRYLFPSVSCIESDGTENTHRTYYKADYS